MMLAVDGSLYTVGDNSLGQLGRFTEGSNREDPEDWLVRDSTGSACQVELVSSWSSCILGHTDLVALASHIGRHAIDENSLGLAVRMCVNEIEGLPYIS